MTDPLKGVETRQVEEKNKKGEMEVKEVKVNKLIYMCRPQVLERRDRWKKFGEVAQIPRGENARGELMIPDIPVVIEDDEGQVDQEIDIAKNLIAISKESMMNKNLRSGK